MISSAKKAGASAVKIQTYEADSMTINSDKKDFRINHGVWKGQKLYDLYNKAKTPFAWHKTLFQHAKEEKILLFSTPFDYKGVDILDSLKVPFFKIASFEITDLSFIEYVHLKEDPFYYLQGCQMKEK